VIAVELRKLFRRPRTWATIGVLNALPVLVAVLLVLTDLAPRPGEGPPFLSAVLSNGALYPLAALAIVLPLFLPIAVAVVAGDSVAGEAQAGTLRYLLVRPAGRTRLLVAKLVAVLAFVLVTVLVVAGVGYVIGAALFEAQPTTGTSLADLAGDVAPEQCPLGCRQLGTDSDLLARLNAGDETPEGPTWVSIWTSQDRTVTPPDSARLEGALNLPVQSICPRARVDHGGLPRDPVVQEIVLAELAAGDPIPLDSGDCARLGG